MSHFQQHPAFFNKPIRLTEAEKRDPMSVIVDFFTDYNMSEVREIHQNMDHICLTSDAPPFDDPEERDSLLSFRESEEKVLEAALILMKSQGDVSASAHPTSPDPEAASEGNDTVEVNDVQDKVLHLQNELMALHNSMVKSFGRGVSLRFRSK